MEKNDFSNLMKQYGKEIEIVFTEEQIEKFYKYMNLLIEWNEKINLTAIIKPEEIILKHFIDSLTILKYIGKNETFLDIGTGAGFPGIPIKIMHEDVNVTLLDSLNKRIRFLDIVIKELKLEKITYWWKLQLLLVDIQCGFIYGIYYLFLFQNLCNLQK